MAQHTMNFDSNYGIPSIADIDSNMFYQRISSTTSSPSPIMWQMPNEFVHQAENSHQETFHDPTNGFSFYDTIQPATFVEFTDLTSPYQEDRRRRRTQLKDKQAISSMHIRRRAQNRASQRAFRERKEKHAQDLQKQLDELESKHKALENSYDELSVANKGLVEQIDILKASLVTVQASEHTTPESLARTTTEGHGDEH